MKDSQPAGPLPLAEGAGGKALPYQRGVANQRDR